MLFDALIERLVFKLQPPSVALNGQSLNTNEPPRS